MSRNPQHLAPTSVKTLAAELIFNAIFGEDTPDRDGRYRAEHTAPVELQAAA